MLFTEFLTENAVGSGLAFWILLGFANKQNQSVLFNNGNMVISNSNI